jgi:hypothetical protein
LRNGDGRTPKTEELQKQKNSNDNGTPIFQIFEKNIIAFDSGTPTTVELQRHKNSSFKNYQKYRTIEPQCLVRLGRLGKVKLHS